MITQELSERLAAQEELNATLEKVMVSTRDLEKRWMDRVAEANRKAKVYLTAGIVCALLSVWLVFTLGTAMQAQFDQAQIITRLMLENTARAVLLTNQNTASVAPFLRPVAKGGQP